MAEQDLMEAVRQTLADYLRTKLAALFPTLVVYQEWPQKNDAAEYTITALVVGDGDYTYFPSTVISTTPDPGPATTGTVVFSYGRCDGLPLQLDCWADAPFKRDALLREIRRALNTPPATSLGLPGGDPLARDPGLVLAAAGLQGALVEYEFTPTLALPENSDDTETNQWRASWRGMARFDLVDVQAGVPLRKHIGLLVGAGEKATWTNQREQRNLTGVTLRVVPAAVSITRPGATKLRVMATFQGGLTADVSGFCTFSSSTPMVASVDTEGRVIAGMNAGSAPITVTYAGTSTTVVATIS